MLHEQAIGRVRTMLLEGDIPPGASIPERELRERLKIFRTPLRQAFKVLAAEGLVRLLPSRGSRAAKLTDPDRTCLRSARGSLAGELACERITDEQSAEIASLHAAMAQHYRAGDLIQYYHCNQAIHEAIVAAAGNPVLWGLYE